MSKSITLNTVQGIGDIFWVYQKLAPHVDVINFNILCTRPADAVQMRSKAFCAMLPKVGEVAFVQTDLANYKRVTAARVPIAAVLAAGVLAASGLVVAGPVDYAVNGPLEQGIGLREIDADFAIEEFVDLGLPATVEQEDYLCVFVSGAQNRLCWTTAGWVRAIQQVAAHIGTQRVALIGAEWDVAVQASIQQKLLDAGYGVENHVGRLLDKSLDVIRRSKFFLAYQSGLSVLADNYDVPQLMVYYPSLEAMMTTWCKRENLHGRYRAMTFNDDLDAQLNGDDQLKVA